MVIVPLFMFLLRPERDAPYPSLHEGGRSTRVSMASLGGTPFILLVFSFITQATVMAVKCRFAFL